MKEDKEKMQDFDFHLFSIIIFLLMGTFLIICGKDSLESLILRSHRQWIKSGIWEVPPVFLLTEK